MNKHTWSIVTTLLYRASFALGVLAWASLTVMAWRAPPEPDTKDNRAECDIFCGAVD